MKKTILLVEDEAKLSELYLRILRRSPYEVLLATSKEEALQLLKKKKIDLILLDLIIPTKHGGITDFTQREGFRIIEEFKGRLPRFIVFTNIDSEEDRAKAKKLRTERYIVKVDLLPKQIMTLIKQYLS